MNCDVCGDNRYELIDKAKRRLVEATNIEDRPEEMAVLDDILLRFWQMGWLDPASKIISLREAVGECREQNAKLRELAKTAWCCVNRHVSCDECRMVCFGCTLQSAMRELGIEVKS